MQAVNIFPRPYKQQVGRSVVLTVLAALAALSASAMTVRAKSDLRFWQTVADRSTPLAWSWEPNADAATLTFSNCLTRTVSSVAVVRTQGAMRGECPHPVPPTADEALVVATLVQTSGGAEIVRETATLAYVPGTMAPTRGCVSTKPITVRAEDTPEWKRVTRPRLSAFDATWWGLAGASGHEVLWSDAPGYRRVTRTFGELTVAEAILRFGVPGLMLFAK